MKDSTAAKTQPTTVVTQSQPEQRKFCSSCSRDKPLEGGVMVKCANGATRWKCASCQAKSKLFGPKGTARSGQ
jgi:hypothetical protein